jgi:ABC-type sugar transport system ATPase subunit
MSSIKSFNPPDVGIAVSPALQAINLNKSYRLVHALQSASLAVWLREIFALVGDDGAGESTLLKSLSGAALPDSDEFCIDSYRRHAASIQEAIAREIQTVFQDLVLAPTLTEAKDVILSHEPQTPRARTFVTYSSEGSGR